MKATFDILQATRNLVLKTIDSLSLEQVNTIPSHFNNNIAWNIGHLVVTQQLLCYGLSNTPKLVSEELIEKYKKGTAPTSDISESEWEEILDLFKILGLQMETDFNQQVFGEFKTYPTSYGYDLNNIEAAIQFNNVHEALHLGYIMALKRNLY